MHIFLLVLNKNSSSSNDCYISYHYLLRCTLIHTIHGIIATLLIHNHIYTCLLAQYDTCTFHIVVSAGCANDMHRLRLLNTEMCTLFTLQYVGSPQGS